MASRPERLVDMQSLQREVIDTALRMAELRRKLQSEENNYKALTEAVRIIEEHTRIQEQSQIAQSGSAQNQKHQQPWPELQTVTSRLAAIRSVPYTPRRSAQQSLANEASQALSCTNWFQTQLVKANCYRAFHSTRQAQDHNSLLKSMHVQRKPWQMLQSVVIFCFCVGDSMTLWQLCSVCGHCVRVDNNSL